MTTKEKLIGVVTFASVGVLAVIIMLFALWIGGKMLGHSPDVQPGQVWQTTITTDYEKGPFDDCDQPPNEKYVYTKRVVAVKDGWVQYETGTTRCRHCTPIGAFTYSSKRIDPER